MEGGGAFEHVHPSTHKHSHTGPKKIKIPPRPRGLEALHRIREEETDAVLVALGHNLGQRIVTAFLRAGDGSREYVKTRGEWGVMKVEGLAKLPAAVCRAICTHPLTNPAESSR